MRQLFLLIALVCTGFMSCVKSSTKSQLPIDGKWRMYGVIDNFSGPDIIKPASVTGDVDITFISATPTTGSFRGNTPTNQIFENAYTIGDNQSISIPALNMTKIAETDWGNWFVLGILGARVYSFSADGNLYIDTGRKTLVFVRL